MLRNRKGNQVQSPANKWTQVNELDHCAPPIHSWRPGTHADAARDHHEHQRTIDTENRDGPPNDTRTGREEGTSIHIGTHADDNFFRYSRKRIIATEDGRLHWEGEVPPPPNPPSSPPKPPSSPPNEDRFPEVLLITTLSILALIPIVCNNEVLSNEGVRNAFFILSMAFVAACFAVFVTLMAVPAFKIVRLAFDFARWAFMAVIQKFGLPQSLWGATTKARNFACKNAKTLILVLTVVAASGALFRAAQVHLRDECDIWTDDPYQILNLPRYAGADNVKVQYKKMSLKCHPDRVDRSRVEVAHEGFLKIKWAHDVLVDKFARQVYEQCGKKGVDLFRQEQGTIEEGKWAKLADRICDMSMANDMCGQVGKEIVRSGMMKANEACSWAQVYETCGENGLSLYHDKVPARDACAWIYVYKTCGEQGLSLFLEGVRPHRACAKLREIKAAQYQAQYESFHAFGGYGYDPMAHLHNAGNPFSYRQRMPYW